MRKRVLERMFHFLLRDKAVITVGRGLTVVAFASITFNSYPFMIAAHIV